MNIINSNINDVKYRGTGCDALYHGANLIWRRGNGEVEDDETIINVTTVGGVDYYLKKDTGVIPSYTISKSDTDYTLSEEILNIMSNLFGCTYASSNGYNKMNLIKRINKFPSVRNAKFLSGLFAGCSSLENVPVLKFSSTCQSISHIFSGCTQITSVDISNWDISNCDSCQLIFSNCTNLNEIIGLEKLNVSSAKGFSGMFSNCTSLSGTLDLSNWENTVATDYSNMFNNASNLEEIRMGRFDFTNLTGISSSISSLFYKCSNLKKVVFPQVVDFKNVPTTETLDAYVFYGCSNLSEIDATFQNIGFNLNLNYLSSLDNKSAMNFINGLKSTNSKRTITFSKATFATLTDEQKQLATNKGWTVASFAY